MPADAAAASKAGISRGKGAPWRCRDGDGAHGLQAMAVRAVFLATGELKERGKLRALADNPR
jgi:hypothetical protein